MWVTTRGSFYCDQCDTALIVDSKIRPRVPNLVGSWYEHSELGPGSTLNGTFMLCGVCASSAYDILQSQNHIYSFVPKEVRCDDCGQRLNLSVKPTDQCLLIFWSNTEKEKEVISGKSSIRLCTRDATEFLNELDKHLKYKSRR